MENTINTEGCRKPNWITDRDKEILCFYLVIPTCGFKLNYCSLVNHLYIWTRSYTVGISGKTLLQVHPFSRPLVILAGAVHLID